MSIDCCVILNDCRILRLLLAVILEVLRFRLLFHNQHSQITLRLDLPVGISKNHTSLMLHDVRSGCELRHVTRFDLGHPGRPLHPRVFIVRRLILILVKHHLVKLGVRRQCRNIVLVGGVQVVKVATQVLLLSALRTEDRRV